ncbi:hypothetical protein Bbelb_209190 [Branchiostoma belcheri]|nr:hypothetical protein Bbelb_209190 [Branchiostoma belcheri]
MAQLRRRLSERSRRKRGTIPRNNTSSRRRFNLRSQFKIRNHRTPRCPGRFLGLIPKRSLDARPIARTLGPELASVDQGCVLALPDSDGRRCAACTVRAHRACQPACRTLKAPEPARITSRLFAAREEAKYWIIFEYFQTWRYPNVSRVTALSGTVPSPAAVVTTGAALILQRLLKIKTHDFRLAEVCAPRLLVELPPTAGTRARCSLTGTPDGKEPRNWAVLPVERVWHPGYLLAFQPVLSMKNGGNHWLRKSVVCLLTERPAQSTTAQFTCRLFENGDRPFVVSPICHTVRGL